jgi:hypothetical protein
MLVEVFTGVSRQDGTKKAALQPFLFPENPLFSAFAPRGRPRI